MRSLPIPNSHRDHKVFEFYMMEMWDTIAENFFIEPILAPKTSGFDSYGVALFFDTDAAHVNELTNIARNLVVPSTVQVLMGAVDCRNCGAGAFQPISVNWLDQASVRNAINQIIGRISRAGLIDPLIGPTVLKQSVHIEASFELDPSLVDPDLVFRRYHHEVEKVMAKELSDFVLNQAKTTLIYKPLFNFGSIPIAEYFEAYRKGASTQQDVDDLFQGRGRLAQALDFVDRLKFLAEASKGKDELVVSFDPGFVEIASDTARSFSSGRVHFHLSQWDGQPDTLLYELEQRALKELSKINQSIPNGWSLGLSEISIECIRNRSNSTSIVDVLSNMKMTEYMAKYMTDHLVGSVYVSPAAQVPSFLVRNRANMLSNLDQAWHPTLLFQEFLRAKNSFIGPSLGIISSSSLASSSSSSSQVLSSSQPTPVTQTQATPVSPRVSQPDSILGITRQLAGKGAGVHLKALEENTNFLKSKADPWGSPISPEKLKKMKFESEMAMFLKPVSEPVLTHQDREALRSAEISKQYEKSQRGKQKAASCQTLFK